MTELEILNKFETGAVAELSLEELTTGAAFCLKVSARTASVLAVTVAKIRKEHLSDVTEWINFCKATFDLEGSYLHQIHKVGKMLLSVTCHTPKVYTVLFRLELYKQLAITQIPVVEIENFIRQQTKPLAKMTRAEVRAAVNRFLNPEGISAAPAKQSEQLLLPGFGKWLETATGFEAESLVRAVDDDDTADRSYRAGCLLLGAALDYHRRQETPDTVMLLNLKTALLDEVQAIETILAQE